jgi:hypothetical protein
MKQNSIKFKYLFCSQRRKKERVSSQLLASTLNKVFRGEISSKYKGNNHVRYFGI